MADIQVANTDSDLSGNTLVTEENAYTITGLHTFSRSTNTPFAVVSGAAVVANLDADKLDGQEGSYYLAAANFTGTLAVANGGTGATSLTDGGVLLGSGTGAITAMSVLTDGQMIVGDGREILSPKAEPRCGPALVSAPEIAPRLPLSPWVRWTSPLKATCACRMRRVGSMSGSMPRQRSLVRTP